MIDFHSHLYPETDIRYKAGLIDLLNYHYFYGEYAKARKYSSQEMGVFLKMPAEDKAKLIWEYIFVHKRKDELSHAGLGVIEIINTLLPNKFSFSESRNEICENFQDVLSAYKTPSIEEIFNITGLSYTIGTYEPGETLPTSPFIKGAVRIDSCHETSYPDIDESAEYYSLSCETHSDVFSTRMRNNKITLYSLMTHFYYEKKFTKFLKSLIDAGKSLWLMLGVARNINSFMGLGGDSIGLCDMRVVEMFAKKFPELNIKFSILDINQLNRAIVAERIFPNLSFQYPWWFNVNTIDVNMYLTKSREILGKRKSEIEFYSDARVLEQLIYKYNFFKSL